LFSQFHFAQGAWLWGLLAIPLLVLLYALFYRRTGSAALLERFADRHLLVHLLKKSGTPGRNIWRPLLLWSVAWACGMVAMAGPRWDYTDQPTFSAPRDLVIVLDLSQSMNVQDVKPSRIARAREEIQDLLDMSHGTAIGLVAYAAVPHMVTPLTDDIRTIRNLLPALDTSLVTLQGDQLQPALEMAAAMLKAEPGDNKSILVISDGNFQDEDIGELARAANGAVIYTMGIGTAAGAAIPGDSGGTQVSRLQAGRLQKLAAAGHGLYVEANYTDADTRAILGRVEASNSNAQASAKSVRVWEERFYIPALVLALLLLPFFKKGATFPVILLLAITVLPATRASAGTVADLFLNRNQQAKEAYDKGDYKSAAAQFDTAYRRGVAAYRAGDYAKAAALFKVAVDRNGDLDALYNLGNAQLMQYNPQNAITSYEAVLKRRPDDARAQHNLAVARKMLAQNQGRKPQQKNKNDKKNDNKQQSGQDKQANNGAQNKQQNKNGQSGKQNTQNGKQNQPQNNQQKQNQQAAQQAPKQQPGQQGQPKQQPGQQTQKQQQTPQDGNNNPSKPSEANRQNGAPQTAQDTTPHSPASGAKPKDAAAMAARVQRDVDADQWLNRVQNDPGSFLKNQFMIEDSKYGSKSGANTQ
jgi:Ca-activated chloride channel family protein